MATNRKPAHLALLAMAAVLALAVVQPALAQGDLSAGDGRVAAASTVQFRIVVHEVVRFEAKHLVADAAPADLRSPPQQRIVEQQDGLQRVTLARP